MNQIRLACDRDVQEMVKIYAPHCGNDSAVSFEIVPPSIEEMQGRLAKTLELYPWLVYVRDDSIMGYAYASSHRPRAAYRWVVDTSIYVSSSAHRSGIGKALYSSLLSILRMQGFVSAHAGITLPNPASMGLHKSIGFTEICVNREVGYKNGSWHDVARLELQLRPRSVPPEEPRQVSSLINSLELPKVLNKAATS